MNRLTITIVLFLCAFTQGCAFTNATLEVGLPADAEFRGPLSSIEPENLQLGNIQDSRIDKDRIGWKKKGYGQNTADILTARPLEDIMHSGLVKALEDNGHKIAETGLRIDSVLNNFWLEFDVNFWTVEFIGNVEAMFILLNESGEELYSNTYSGSYSEKSGGGGKKTWARVMSKALAALFDDFTFDEDFVEALDSATMAANPIEAVKGKGIELEEQTPNKQGSRTLVKQNP